MRFDLAGHRRRARSLMTDRCVIREPDAWIGEAFTEGPVAWRHEDEDEIPCRIKIDGYQPQETTVGGEGRQLMRLTVSLPVDICPTKDQVITVVVAKADLSLVGRRFDVLLGNIGSQITARRVSCLEHDGRIQRD